MNQRLGHCELKIPYGDFPGGPVAKTELPMQGDWYTEAEVPILWPPDANGQGTRSCVPQLRPSTAKQISSFF